jgi:hypothetical protein
LIPGRDQHESECMIRGLPHFVKPDEDRDVQLRDLEEPMERVCGKSALSSAHGELGGRGGGRSRAPRPRCRAEARRASL